MAQVAFTKRCGGWLNEAEPAVARYRKLCAAELAAPGAEGLRDARAKCAARRATSGCDEVVPECDLPPGTLPVGSPCASRAQCQSRFCKLDDSGCGTCQELVEPDGVCSAPSDCATGEGEIASCDFRGSTATSGTCSIWRLSKLNEPCGNRKICGEGLHCVPGATEGEGTCRAVQDEGGSCEDTSYCKPGLVCRSGQCGPRAAEGEACAQGDDCANGLACDGTCRPIYYVRNGETCDVANRCERGRCVATVSEGQERPNHGTCVAPIPDGEACGPQQAAKGLVCDFFARCSGGKCVFPDPSQCQ